MSPQLQIVRNLYIVDLDCDLLGGVNVIIRGVQTAWFEVISMI